MTCFCGFVFRAGRFCVSFDVYDNNRKSMLVTDSFNCESADVVIGALRNAADKIEQAQP